MAKLGMPNVIVSFEEAGIAAIERSKRGIVALILEEEQSVIDKLIGTNATNIVGEAVVDKAVISDTSANNNTCQVAQAGLELLSSGDLPTSASQSARLQA